MGSSVPTEKRGRTGIYRFAHMLLSDLLRQTRAPSITAQHSTLHLLLSPLLPHTCCSHLSLLLHHLPRNHLQHEVAKEHRDSHDAAFLPVQNILCSPPGGLCRRDVVGSAEGTSGKGTTHLSGEESLESSVPSLLASQAPVPTYSCESAQ